MTKNDLLEENDCEKEEPFEDNIIVCTADSKTVLSEIYLAYFEIGNDMEQLMRDMDDISQQYGEIADGIFASKKEKDAFVNNNDAYHIIAIDNIVYRNGFSSLGLDVLEDTLDRQAD